MRFSFLSLLTISGMFLINFRLIAADWYVDNGANGDNNGSSWTNAWESFADINWGSVGPGDYIYISDGTYNETLSIDAAGTSESRIYIMTGAMSPSPTGHDGLVTIDGETTRDYAIQIESTDDYITIDGNDGDGNINLLTKHTLQQGVYINSAAGTKIFRVEVRNAGEQDEESLCYGVRIISPEANTGTEFAYCKIDTTRRMGIVVSGRGYAQYGSAASIHHNIIRDNGEDCLFWEEGVDCYNNEIGPNLNQFEYSDAMQILGGWSRVYNNVIHMYNSHSVDGSHAIIYFEQFNDRNVGHIKIYNNLLWVAGASYDEHRWRAIYIKQNNTDWVDSVLVLNNTVVGNGLEGIMFRGLNASARYTNCIVANNILYDGAHNNPNYNWTFVSSDLDINASDIQVSHNIIYEGPNGGTVMGWGGVRYTSVAAFDMATGYTNFHCIPSFNSSYTPRALDNIFYLNETDNCARDRGLDFSQYFNTDIDGNPRRGEWDIGAFEFQGAVAGPSKPSNLRIEK